MPIPATIPEIEAALAHKTVYEAAALVHEWLHPLAVGERVRILLRYDDDDICCDAFAGDDDEWLKQRAYDEHFRGRCVWVEVNVPPPVAEPVVVGRIADAE